MGRPRKKKTIDPLKITIKDIVLMEDGSEFKEYLYRLFLAWGTMMLIKLEEAGISDLT
ncbi:hypothetical protein D3C75_874100 [compost metagenome]